MYNHYKSLKIMIVLVNLAVLTLGFESGGSNARVYAYEDSPDAELPLQNNTSKIIAVGESRMGTSAPQQEAENATLLGQIGGASFAVAVQGNYAYIGVGPRLVVLNISDPAHPAKLGQSEALPDWVYGIAVAGNYAYVVSGLYLHTMNSPTR